MARRSAGRHGLDAGAASRLPALGMIYAATASAVAVADDITATVAAVIVVESTMDLQRRRRICMRGRACARRWARRCCVRKVFFRFFFAGRAQTFFLRPARKSARTKKSCRERRKRDADPLARLDFCNYRCSLLLLAHARRTASHHHQHHRRCLDRATTCPRARLRPRTIHTFARASSRTHRRSPFIPIIYSNKRDG